MSEKTYYYSYLVQNYYFMVFIASGFQSVLLCPSLMTVHVQRESIPLTQGIRTIKTLIKCGKGCSY